MLKMLGSILGIAVLGLIVLAGVSLRNSDFRDRAFADYQHISQKARINVENFLYNVKEDASPTRKRSDSTMQQEDKLKLFMPDIFQNYSKQDWDDFWKLIYGRRPVGNSWIKQRRYRSVREIQKALAYRYPEPFGYFQGQHWQYFWSIIAENKGFVDITYPDQEPEQWWEKEPEPQGVDKFRNTIQPQTEE